MIKIPGRIPIIIHPFFWVLVLLIGWLNSATFTGMGIWAAVIIISVLFHEYGHALTAIVFGQKTRIELVGLGGVTIRQGPKLKTWKEFLVVFNGPAAGFLLFLAFAYVYGFIPKEGPLTPWHYFVLAMMYANLFWTLVNLLPIHPLDGGKLVGILLEGIFGVAGLRASLLLSSFFALAASLLFFSISSILGGALFMLLAFESYRAWKGSQTMSRQDQDDALQQKLKEAQESLQAGREGEAQSLLEEIRNKTNEGMIYLAATEALASIYQHQGRLKEAFYLLIPHKDQLAPEAFKQLHQLAFKIGDFKEAISLGDQSYQLYPTYETALTNALSYSLLGELKPAVGWLQRAISDGLPNPREVLDKVEFNNIRNTPIFQALLNKIRG